VLGAKKKIDPQHAALLNGIASHVHDYDDTHYDKFIHPTGPVASALLAVAEWKGGITGKDLILALVAGVEAECKVGLSVWPEHYNVGWYVFFYRIGLHSHTARVPTYNHLTQLIQAQHWHHWLHRRRRRR
jgi:2-methylcitrate dehydratase PrpD